MADPRGEQSLGREPGGCGGPWGTLRGPPPALLPCPCPVLAGCSLLPPPLSLLAPPVSPGCGVPPGLLPCAGPCPPCCPPSLPREPGRARAAAARESSGALRAWLARHPRNPYPSKGEKALLAVASRLSLAQVSTWFANARRRLRRENKAGWAPPADGEDSGGEGAPPAASPGPGPAQDGCGGSPGGGPGAGQGGQPQQPKIWSVAAMLAPSPGESSGRPGVPAVPEQG